MAGTPVRHYIDLNTDQITTGPGTNEPLQSVSYKRGVGARIEIQFLRNGIVEELADGATGIFALKPQGEYDATPIVYAGTWTKQGTGGQVIYVFDVDFDSDALNLLLGHDDGDVSNDQEFILAMGEIEWKVSGSTHKTQTFEARIENDVIKEMDADPAEIAGPTRWVPAALELDAPPEDGELAHGNIYPIGDLPLAGTSLTVGSVDYTFANYPASNPYEIAVGYDAYDAVNKIVAAINGTDFVNTPHPEVSAGAGSGPSVGLTSKLAGEAGNGIEISTSNPAVLNIVAMSGGVDGTIAKCPGHSAIVNGNDVYICVKFSPVKWVPLNV